MFSADLRTATWTIHRRAERTTYLEALFRGTVSLAGYARMVAQHYFIYEELEKAAAALRADPTVRGFAPVALDRLPALEADLCHLVGPDWAGQVTASPATERYRDRIRDVCFSWPGGFVAHHYTRYLGDLSGGQYIRASVARTYGLTGPGLAFYDFPGLGDLARFKESYRAALDAASWSADEQERVIAETLVAYELNIDVLNDLGADLEGVGA